MASAVSAPAVLDDGSPTTTTTTTTTAAAATTATTTTSTSSVTPLDESTNAKVDSPTPGRSKDSQKDSQKATSQTSGLSVRSQSFDSLNPDQQSTTAHSAKSVSSRDGSTKSSRSGVKKLLPGVGKRKQRKIREEEEELRQALTLTPEDKARGRPRSSTATATKKAKQSSDESVGLIDPLPLTASPGELDPARSATIEDYLDSRTRLNTVPALVQPDQSEPSPSPSPSSSSPALARPASLPSPAQLEKPEMLAAEIDSINGGGSTTRSRSPGRKFRNVFSKAKGPKPVSPQTVSPKGSPKGSPERKSVPTFASPLSKSVAILTDEPKQAPPPVPAVPPKSIPPLDITSTIRPLTPPAATIATPATTVTPPTPTLETAGTPTRSDTDSSVVTVKGDNITVSPSGNMISHRRVRSSSSSVHQPSKLVNSMTASAIPTIQETRVASTSSTAAATNRSASGSFLSSWMSAAQTAASTLTNLTIANRSRAGTNASESAQSSTEQPTQEDDEAAGAGAGSPQAPRRQPAVETMGSGDLNFEHLGLDTGSARSMTRPSFTDLRHESLIARDMAAAKAEDALAQKAVSAAYERPEDATPVAELPDPITSQAHANASSGLPRQTTQPNAAIVEADPTSVKRTTSVRSKLATRSSRRSSATGQSAIGVLISGSTAALANPATGPRLSGFTMAPKGRNKSFHQQFRSVPEDDYLIEDYSCALQKDILLAGRLYISEGHICFSSNILGWVTTLIISFEEVVNIERENTALVIPNAIAIQTLHARHIFRSLLSREATYDLMLGIWRVSHPASFQKSSAGKSQVAREALKDASGNATSDKGSERISDGSSENDSADDDDDDDDDSDHNDAHSASSTGESALSVGPSEMQDSKNASRMLSGAQTQGNPSPPSTAVPADFLSAPGLLQAGAGGGAGAGADLAQDFPGPAAHSPTECTDASSHFEIIIKDEVVPAPLGKVYSLLYGPQSSTFMRKFLVDECKSLDLQLEDSKTGLCNEKKSRQYTYIKPLNGSIGPKQTKCITTEELDFYDLDKAVSVTCSTQTPDVPSGASFVTKTRYCLTWAAGNATRLQMNCTVEWSAKSWLKVPIEKGAKDGQQQYGDSLVKVLKSNLGRARGMTSNSKLSKSAKKKTKRAKKEKTEAGQADTTLAKKGNWGLLHPLRPYLGPIVSIVEPAVKLEYVVSLLFVMVLILWFSQPRAGGGYDLGGHWGSIDAPERLAAYEQLWYKEETELWDWLEQRAGANTAALLQKRSASASRRGEADHRHHQAKTKAKTKAEAQKAKQMQRQRILQGKDTEARLREEKMSAREMEEALTVARQRLEILEQAIKKQTGSIGQ